MGLAGLPAYSLSQGRRICVRRRVWRPLLGGGSFDERHLELRGHTADAGVQAATIRILPSVAREWEGHGEGCEVSSLRRSDRGSEVLVLRRRAPDRCG